MVTLSDLSEFIKKQEAYEEQKKEKERAHRKLIDNLRQEIHVLEKARNEIRTQNHSDIQSIKAQYQEKIFIVEKKEKELKDSVSVHARNVSNFENDKAQLEKEEKIFKSNIENQKKVLEEHLKGIREKRLLAQKEIEGLETKNKELSEREADLEDWGNRLHKDTRTIHAEFKAGIQLKNDNTKELTRLKGIRDRQKSWQKDLDDKQFRLDKLKDEVEERESSLSLRQEQLDAEIKSYNEKAKKIEDTLEDARITKLRIEDESKSLRERQKQLNNKEVKIDEKIKLFNKKHKEAK